MKYEVGDVVRIRSREWIDAQEKDEDGRICRPDAPGFIKDMFNGSVTK
jgi:hypothetical protein